MFFTARHACHFESSNPVNRHPAGSLPASNVLGFGNCEAGLPRQVSSVFAVSFLPLGIVKSASKKNPGCPRDTVNPIGHSRNTSAAITFAPFWK